MNSGFHNVQIQQPLMECAELFQSDVHCVIWKTLGHIPLSYPHDDMKSLFFPVASDIFPLAS